jgi:hypothetical protein
MLDVLINRLRNRPLNVCFCTLAIHAPYRRRARLLCADAPHLPWIVLTDEPDEFADLPVRAIQHLPTGPMAVDFLTTLPPLGNGRGRPAYHDKRFVVRTALEKFDTAIFVDADSRIASLPRMRSFPRGIAVVPEVRSSISEHLKKYGTSRLSAFEELARLFTGNTEVLKSARWCGEALFAVTKDGRESRFLEAWESGADFLQSRGVFSGEGGVIGLAAAQAGWEVDYKSLLRLAFSIKHEGLGPKPV